MRVMNMVSPRTGEKVANQFIIAGDHRLTFQSYDSMIIDLDFMHSVITIGKDWDFSRTTSKYRNAFLAEHLPQLATKKAIESLKAMADENGRIETVINAVVFTVIFE